MEYGNIFLHNHPRKEEECGLNTEHVIVDRDDWEFLRSIIKTEKLPPTNKNLQMRFWELVKPGCDRRCRQMKYIMHVLIGIIIGIFLGFLLFYHIKGTY